MVIPALLGFHRKYLFSYPPFLSLFPSQAGKNLLHPRCPQQYFPRPLRPGGTRQSGEEQYIGIADQPLNGLLSVLLTATTEVHWTQTTEGRRGESPRYPTLLGSNFWLEFLSLAKKGGGGRDSGVTAFGGLEQLNRLACSHAAMSRRSRKWCYHNNGWAEICSGDARTKGSVWAESNLFGQ